MLLRILRIVFGRIVKHKYMALPLSMIFTKIYATVYCKLDLEMYRLSANSG